MQILAVGVEQIFPLAFFILLFVVLGWFQRNGPKQDEPQEEEGSVPHRHPNDLFSSRKSQENLSLEEENMRRLWKSLGLPQEEQLPPPENPPPLPQKHFPFSPPLPRSQSKQIFPKLVNQQATEPPDKKQISAKAKREIIAKVAPSSSQWLQDLAQDPSTLRQGIILREVLGLPKALE